VAGHGDQVDLQFLQVEGRPISLRWFRAHHQAAVGTSIFTMAGCSLTTAPGLSARMASTIGGFLRWSEMR
jgi:hypothetical protein